MTILTPTTLFVILQAWSFVLPLVSQVWLEQQLYRYRKHWLVQLNDLLDFASLEQGCAGFHQNSGLGRPVEHSVPRLVRMLLLRHLQNLSLRQTEEWVDNHLLWKWFVGYGLFERVPDHSTLCRFELWVLRHQDRLFFDTVLKQVYALYPSEKEQLFLSDTFGMYVRGAKTYTIELLRDLSRRLLRDLADLDPARSALVLAELDEEALFGVKGDLITPALNPEQRAERLQKVGNAALALGQHLATLLEQTPFLEPEAEISLRLWLSAINKVLTDECTLQPDPAQPGYYLITERKHGKKGSYRIACANDLEGTYRDHGKGSAELQYNNAILTSTDFIHETTVVTGAAPDGLTLAPMVETLQQHHLFCPPKIAVDQAYGTGKCRAEVEQASQGHTQVIALVPAYEKGTERFVPADFTPAEDGLSLTCPNGVTSYQFYPKATADGQDFRFTAKMCAGCPYWISKEQYQADPTLPHCRKPGCNPTSHRQVFISAYRQHILDALAYNKTEQFKTEIKQRPLVERIIFNLTHFFGARHARSTGLEKANFQLRMAAMAFNLRQLVRRQTRAKQLVLGLPREQCV